ncbi:STAS domain-containing protein [Streptomyces mobaraensis]|uniref:STAS domain-containing protein n=1 Tax=Streptomyces mobaraensis TaxID=35621 RepID=UPI003324B5C7
MSQLNITRHDTPDGPVLRLDGELDYEHAAALRRHVDRLVLQAGQCLVIDLSGLRFCDSTGITALLAARQHAHAAGADIALDSVPANTLRLLRVVGLDRILTIRTG